MGNHREGQGGKDDGVRSSVYPTGENPPMTVDEVGDSAWGLRYIG